MMKLNLLFLNKGDDILELKSLIGSLAGAAHLL